MQVDGTAHLLAQGQDVDEIKKALVDAARNGADMITVTVVGNRSLDVLVTPGVAITFESETVPEDDRDDGNLEAPFHFDDFDSYTAGP